MAKEASFDEEVVAIDAQMNRPHFRLHLARSFEEKFRLKTGQKRTRVIRYWHCVAIAANAAGLALDRISGVLDHGLIARFAFVVPCYVLALLLLDRGPAWLRNAAAIVPSILFATALGYLARESSPPDSDRYVMAAGVVILFTNIAVPLHFANAVFMTLASFGALLGSAFLYYDPSINDVAMLAFIVVISAIALVIRYRTEWDARQSFLDGLLDEIKSAQLTALTKALGRLAETDPMTGMFNRRHLVRTLAKKWEEARRNNNWIGILMIDIDKFKEFNDTSGHGEGDRCLNAVAGKLNGEVLKADHYIARYGGEEFVAVISQLGPEALVAEAERIRRSIEMMNLPHPALGPGGRVTVSIGVAAMIPTPHATVDDLLIAADKALYASKAAGRNRVEAHSAVGLLGNAHGQGARPAVERVDAGRLQAVSRH